MAQVKLYFSPALLLLVFICPLWQVSQSIPVTSKEQISDHCVFYARALLWNITDTLSQNQLFTGIDCTKQNVELYTETETASVCAPQKSTCSGTFKLEFNQKSCLTQIWKDLHHYYRFLAAQPRPNGPVCTSILLSIRKLMQNCFTQSLPADLNLDQAAADYPNTYDERLRLCKVLRGFQVRAITINRVIAYMNSGEQELNH